MPFGTAPRPVGSHLRNVAPKSYRRTGTPGDRHRIRLKKQLPRQLLQREAGRIASIIVDRPGTTSVAAWAYAHNAQLGAPVWSHSETVKPLTDRWRTLLDT